MPRFVVVVVVVARVVVALCTEVVGPAVDEGAAVLDGVATVVGAGVVGAAVVGAAVVGAAVVGAAVVGAATVGASGLSGVVSALVAGSVLVASDEGVGGVDVSVVDGERATVEVDRDGL